MWQRLVWFGVNSRVNYVCSLFKYSVHLLKNYILLENKSTRHKIDPGGSTFRSLRVFILYSNKWSSTIELLLRRSFLDSWQTYLFQDKFSFLCLRQWCLLFPNNQQAISLLNQSKAKPKPWRLGLLVFPALGTGSAFSRSWNRLRGFTRLAPDVHFYTLGINYMFSRAWHQLHVWPDLIHWLRYLTSLVTARIRLL